MHIVLLIVIADSKAMMQRKLPPKGTAAQIFRGLLPFKNAPGCRLAKKTLRGMVQPLRNGATSEDFQEELSWPVDTPKAL